MCYINWPGNKSKHINKFEKYIPEEIFDEKWSGTYIEPFVGGGAMLIKLDKRGVIWMMTQADTKFIRNVFKNHTIKTFKVSGQIHNFIHHFHSNFTRFISESNH